MQYCSIYVTTSTEDEAARIGRTLVEEKLAACANIRPGIITPDSEITTTLSRMGSISSIDRL